MKKIPEKYHINFEIEKAYWYSESKNSYIPIAHLSKMHLINIVLKYGADFLIENGYGSIVLRFDELKVREWCYNTYKSAEEEKEQSENSISIKKNRHVKQKML